jgi:hypothetical protein
VQGQFDDDSLDDEHSHIEEVVREGPTGKQLDSMSITNHPCNDAIGQTVEGRFDDDSLGDERSHLDETIRGSDSDLASTTSRLTRATSGNAASYPALVSHPMIMTPFDISFWQNQFHMWKWLPPVAQSTKT